MDPRLGSVDVAQGPKWLLLVENDVRILELLCLFLERRGYRVRSAKSLEEARAELNARRPDLMLSDIDLGRSNGREFLPQLSREGVLPRTLVVSGYLDAQLAEELRAVPEVIGVLPKPFEFDRLERRIEEALRAPLRDAPRPETARAASVDVAVS